MHQFNNPAGYPPAPFQWPSFAPVPGSTGPAPYPAIAPSYPPAAPPGYPGAAPYPAAAVPPGYPGGAPLGLPAPNFTAPGGVPAFYMPDEEMVRAAYRESQEEAQRTGGSRAQYVKFPGPGGQPKWGPEVPVGYESVIPMYLLPAWAPGKNLSRRVRSHFWRSHEHPKGSSLACPGPESCLICKARDLAINSTDLMMQKRAKEYGRARTQYLYNVVILNNPHGHLDRSGVMRPFILGAPTTLNAEIGKFIDARGLLHIVHPLSGRPLQVTRRRTGTGDMDIEYSVMDMNPQPLPEYFYPALSALWDLDAEDKGATVEQQMRMLSEIGLPIPSEASGMPMGMPMGVPSPGAPMMPAGPNPYQQTFGAVGGGAGVFPAFTPPPAPAAPNFYPQSATPPPGNFGHGAPPPPPPPFSGMQPPPAPPFQGFSGMQPPPPPPPPSPFSGMFAPPPPPAMAMPPPVQSAPLAGGNPYAPQPGPGGFPGMVPPPPPPPLMPGVQPVGMIPYPVPPGLALPGGRERCFGKCSPQDRYCQECIPGIREQCAGVAQQMQGSAQPAAPGIPPPPATGAPPSLEALSHQLRGG